LRKKQSLRSRQTLAEWPCGRRSMRCFPTRVARTAMWRTPVRVGQAQNSRSRACSARQGQPWQSWLSLQQLSFRTQLTGLARPSRSAEVAACSGGNGMVRQVIGGDMCPDQGSRPHEWPWIRRNRGSHSKGSIGRLGLEARRRTGGGPGFRRGNVSCDRALESCGRTVSVTQKGDAPDC
jgi:hypothetical protein